MWRPENPFKYSQSQGEYSSSDDEGSWGYSNKKEVTQLIK